MHLTLYLVEIDRRISSKCIERKGIGLNLLLNIKIFRFIRVKPKQSVFMSIHVYGAKINLEKT